MENNMDMLSLLPDSLLLIILSFLPFMEAAKTCILSKRYSNMWKSTRSIEFNELHFVKDWESHNEQQRTVFLCFIKNWISHYRDRVLNKFSLKLSNPQNCMDIVQHCIKFAAKRDVKELVFDFSDPNWDEIHHNNKEGVLIVLPEQFYQDYQTLQSLKLYSCGLEISKLHNFVVLKDVSFGWIKITTSAIRNLLSTCKLIESLSLKCCSKMQDFDMGDGELGLKRLVIEKCEFVYDYLRFNAPCLKYFKYCGEIIGISEMNVRRNVMEEADIDFGMISEFSEWGNELYRILEDLYPAKVLTVCSVLLQVVPFGDEPVRIQTGLNVKHLIMKTQMHPHELWGFMFLLNSCPNLHTLTLNIAPQEILPGYSPPNNVDLKKFWEKVVVPSCLRRTLKVMEVKGFRGTMDELLACYYFLKAAKVLQKINIYIFNEQADDNNGEVNNQKLQLRLALARYLLTLPKASKNLKIEIFN